MEEMWLARDKDGKLAIFNKKPLKYREQWITKGRYSWICQEFFPEVQWRDEEPTKLKLVISPR